MTNRARQFLINITDSIEKKGHTLGEWVKGRWGYHNNCNICGAFVAEPLMIYRADVRSKYNGQVMITNGEKFQREWYGRIDLAGVFHQQPGVTEEIVEILEQLSKDPAGTAAAYGKLTGNCCFCYRKLEDDRSTSVGYGPVCAKHFGLAWGARPAPQAVTQTPLQRVSTQIGGTGGTLGPGPSYLRPDSNWTLSEGHGEQHRYIAELSDFGPDRRGMVCPDCQAPLQEQPLIPQHDGEGGLTHYEGDCKCGAHITLFND